MKKLQDLSLEALLLLKADKEVSKGDSAITLNQYHRVIEELNIRLSGIDFFEK
jgi:hypothetical protein